MLGGGGGGVGRTGGLVGGVLLDVVVRWGEGVEVDPICGRGEGVHLGGGAIHGCGDGYVSVEDKSDSDAVLGRELVVSVRAGWVAAVEVVLLPEAVVLISCVGGSSLRDELMPWVGTWQCVEPVGCCFGVDRIDVCLVYVVSEGGEPGGHLGGRVPGESVVGGRGYAVLGEGCEGV